MGGNGHRGRWPRRWLLAAVLAACLAGAASAQAQPFVYVTNQNASTFLPGSVSQFDALGGALSPLAPPSVAAGADPMGIAVNPDGNSVYVTNALDNTVSQFDVGAAGTLTPKSPATVPTTSPREVAVSPDGKSVYVTNAIVCNGTVAQFDVGADGTLTPKAPATVAAGCHPNGVAVSPDGKSVYVTNAVFASGGVKASVSQYDVGAGGALTPKTPANVTTPSNPMDIAVSLDGSSVYVPESGDASGGPGVLQFDVGTGGALTPKTPFIVAAGAQPNGIAVSPDGKSVYVVNHCTPTLSDLGSMSQYDIGTGGALTAKTPATVATGPCPEDVAVSPDGKSAYATSSLGGTPSGGTVSQYDVGASGALTPKTPATLATGSFPFAIAVTPLPRMPTSKEQCKNGGWRNYPQFKNQGQCVSFVETGK
jgi:DNA-binding beta-propeller fold protein YncE